LIHYHTVVMKGCAAALLYTGNWTAGNSTTNSYGHLQPASGYWSL